MMRTLLILVLVMLTSAAMAEDPVKIVSWNIANLHHVDGEPLRGNAQPRDKEDYERLAAFAASIDAQIFALQEIGSPAAARRIFPESDYHLFISDRYKPGDENRPPEQRDIYTAFAVSKEAFPQAPPVSTMPEFSIANIEINSGGKAVNRPTRAGMLLSLNRDGKQIEILNLHLKSSCHGNSLQPVFDTKRDGRLNGNRYDCRTLAAQGMMLENWIEQRRHLGNSILVLGDMNRRLNSLDDVPNKNEHFWRDLNDGSPNGLVLHKGPLGKNTNCWVNNSQLFFDEHIDFLIFDDSLSAMIDAGDIEKIALPHQDDPKYTGRAGQKLSDHCPVAGVLN